MTCSLALRLCCCVIICSDQDDVSTTSQANNADNSLLPLPLPVTYSPMDTNSSSIMVLNDDQPKQDNLTAVGPPFPVVQTTPSFNFGYMPPMLANVLSRPEGFESQAHVLNSLVRLIKAYVMFLAFCFTSGCYLLPVLSLTFMVFLYFCYCYFF